mmetsp:Transcript_21763/g.68377  ORF Transcript_21763/g.68377 Transcript_21763/m.68377 type:complete len:243 (+) Transcript_21763:489-1217(+)
MRCKRHGRWVEFATVQRRYSPQTRLHVWAQWRGQRSVHPSAIALARRCRSRCLRRQPHTPPTSKCGRGHGCPHHGLGQPGRWGDGHEPALVPFARSLFAAIAPAPRVSKRQTARPHFAAAFGRPGRLRAGKGDGRIRDAAQGELQDQFFPLGALQGHHTAGRVSWGSSVQRRRHRARGISRVQADAPAARFAGRGLPHMHHCKRHLEREIARRDAVDAPVRSAGESRAHARRAAKGDAARGF